MDSISLETFDLEDEFKDQWESEIKRLEDLSKKIKSLHVKCLYCRTPAIAKPAKEAWASVIKNVSGSSGHWRELGVLLGLPREDLDYIEHSVTADKTDTILRVYMQNETATMDKVTTALAKMKRFDVLKAVENPLLLMSCYFKDNTTSSDAGYSSYNDSLIITPKNVPNSLPEVLRSDENGHNEFKQEQISPKSSFLMSFSKIDVDKPVLFLTFAEDGKHIADMIPGWVQEWSNEGLEVQIVTLNERRNEVQLNPEVVIQELIEKADYIVPIVTEGYLQAVSRRDPIVPNTTENLDFQYARFIYSFLLHRFTLIDSCFNKNVRCILPKYVDSSITLKFKHYLILVPWTCEEDFDVTFKDLTKRAQAKRLQQN